MLFSQKITIFGKIWYQKRNLWLTYIPKMYTFIYIRVIIRKLQLAIVFTISGFTFPLSKCCWSQVISMHGTSVLLTHFFDSNHMDVNDSATLMFVSFCIIKSKDWSIDMAERTWLNEPYHDTLYNGLLVGPTKMVTGAFKLALWKTIIIHSLHAWVACKQAIICTGRVTVRRTRNSWVYMISNSSVHSDSRNWKFANKNTYKRSNRIPREIWLSWRSILGTNK